MSLHTLINGNNKLFVEFDELGQLHFQHLKPPILTPKAQLSLTVLCYTRLSPELRAAMRKALDVIDNTPPATAT